MTKLEQLFFSLSDDYHSGNHALTRDAAIRWARRDYWSNLDACLLLCGIDPDKLLTPEITYLELLNFKELVEIDPIEAHNRLRELYDASENSRMFKVSLRPIEFILWATHLQLPMPSELREFVMKFKRQLPSWGVPMNIENDGNTEDMGAENWIYDSNYLHRINLSGEAVKSENDNVPLHPRVNTSLQKLVIGMAMASYGFDPRKGRNKTGLIVGALERFGITMDQGTVKSIMDQCFDDLDYDLSLLDDAG